MPNTHPASTTLLDRPSTELHDPDVPDHLVYIAAISGREMFVDGNYQRDLDLPRAKAMAAAWDIQKVGVIDISDRGADHAPDRYAIINGQHRWAAAKLRDPNAVMVANVHTGLTLREEARLFWEIDESTRRLTGWDRWKARRGSADPDVLAIEAVVDTVGLRVEMAPQNGNVRCVSTLERVYRLGGTLLLENALRLIVEVWGHRLDAVDAPLVLGVALILHDYADTLDYDRLGEVLIDLAPRQIKARAQAMRETESGQVGKLAALVMIGAYNSSRVRPKLDRNQLGRRGKDSARQGKRGHRAELVAVGA